MVRTGKRRLPRYEPIVSAMTARTARIQAKPGTVRPLEMNPVSPAIEFTRMNNADTAAAVWKAPLLGFAKQSDRVSDEQRLD